MEHTGDYYNCLDCEHIWDFNDSHCPNCGSQQFEDINANRVKEISQDLDTDTKQKLKLMLESHDDQ